jgi:amino acid transporter
VVLVQVGLWIPAVINLSGVKNMGSVQIVTTVVKFVVLAFMATVVSGSTGRRSSWRPARWRSASLSTWGSAATCPSRPTRRPSV